MLKKIIILSTLLFSTSLLAADSSSGCGPGWYLFKKNSLVSSALRATTNGILFPSTTLGMTLGTSNCSQHKLVKTEKRSLKFITENYFEVASEMAQGEGDFLHSYAATIGCKGAAIKLFKAKAQSHFGQIYKVRKISPEKVLKETYMLILRNKELTKSCSLS